MTWNTNENPYYQESQQGFSNMASDWLVVVLWGLKIGWWLWSEVWKFLLTNMNDNIQISY